MRKKMISVLVMISVLFSTLQMQVYGESMDDIVDFPDNNLKLALLRSGVDTNNDGEISISEAKGVTELDLSRKNITNITGIEHFTSLTKLFLHYNNIADVSPLLKLPPIKTLSLERRPLNNSTVKNGVCIGELIDFFGDKYEVWVPSGFVIDDGHINEAALDGGSIVLELNPTTFDDDSLDKENFILENAPASLRIDRVEYIDSNHARVYFAYDGHDFDSNDLKITIKGAELTNSNLDLIFKDDIPEIFNDDKELIGISHDGNITEGHEDGEILTVNIYGGEFSETIHPENWNISNLPAGVTKGSVKRINDNTVEITLAGNSTGGYDIDTMNITVSCTVDEYVDSTGGTTLEGVLVNDRKAPSVELLSPVNGSDTHEAKEQLKINFDENVVTGTGNIRIYKDDDSLAGSIDVTGGKVKGIGTKTITIDSSTILAGGTAYYIQIDGTCFKDTNGNYYAGIGDKTSWKFTTSIYFPDAYLKRALIRSGVDSNDDKEISISEAQRVIKWELFSCGISDITGLEHFTGLTEIDLNSNNISDLSPLSNLKGLTALNLSRNPNLSDLTPLSNLKGLTKLNLEVNESLSDISPLANLTNLTELDLSNTSISDISPLSNLTGLTKLALRSNRNLRDISPLSNLTDLTELYLATNPNLSDISPLSNLTGLTKIELHQCNISDISALSNLTLLPELSLYQNNVSDVSPLSNLTGLTELSLGDNKISDVSPLSSLTNLTDLQLTSNNISDISPLSSLTNLTSLDLAGNNISDIRPVSSLKSLTSLNLQQNDITEISPVLLDLKSLTNLYLAFNKISDTNLLAELVASLKSLTGLSLHGNNISDLRLIGHLYHSTGVHPSIYENPCYDSTINNGMHLSDLDFDDGIRDYYGDIDEVWVPAGFVKGSSGMTEAELDHATIDLELYPTTFADSSLDPSNFVLENAPAGVSIERVDYIDDNKCSVNLAFDGTDFASDFTDVRLTIKGAELAKDAYGYTYSELVFKDDMPDIKANDETSPIVSSFSPANGDTDIAVNSNLEITFDENIKKGTGEILLFRASDDTVIESVYADSSKVSVSGEKATINPEKNLENETKYYVKIEKGCFRDESGNDYEGINDQNTWSFTTGAPAPDTDAPKAIEFSPANGEKDIAINSNLEITFDENIEVGTGDIIIFQASDDTVVESVYANSNKVSVRGVKATINPNSNLENETKYYVKIEKGFFRDEAGNDYEGINDQNTWSFTTTKEAIAPDKKAPKAIDFSPANGAKDIAINSNLEITFDENIEVGTGDIIIFTASDDTVVESVYADSSKVSVRGMKVTINPKSNLENGTKYYVKIEKGCFKDETGNIYEGINDQNTWSFTTISKKNGGGSSHKGNSSSSNNTNNVEIKVNGKKQETLGKSQTETKNGQTVTTIKLDEKKLEQKLKEEGKRATVTIPVETSKGLVVGQLNGDMVKTMEQKEAVLEIKTQTAAYTLPAKQIKIDQVSKELGKEVELKDIKVEVEIGETPKEMVKIVENTAKKDTFTLVVPPVDFTVKCTNGSKTVEVKEFSDYVERMIAIPDGVDPNKITTGLIVYPDGTTCHVPTKVTVINGKYYAKINSLTNSTYSIIWNPKEYKDVEGHWAKEVCNEMGARKVVATETETIFSPDKPVTRLFFTQTLVRALGLGEKGTQYKFKDVDKNKPYFGAIATGLEYDIVSGYEDNTFRALNNVTREEAASLIVRSMKIAGLKVDYTKEELQNELDKFKDKEAIGAWAREVVAICVKNGMIVGNEKGEFMPKGKMTKAELAVIMNKMLKKAKLI